MSLIFIACIAFLAALIQTTGGFGFGSLFVPFISLILPYKNAAMISVLTCIFLQITIIIRYFKKIKWNLIIIPAIFSFITSTIGVHLMVGFSAKTMSLLLGIFLWILAIYLIKFAPKIQLSKNIFTEACVGSLSGLSGGLFAVGGPPMVAYYDSVIDDPITYQATIQTYFFLTSIILLVNDLIYTQFTNRLSLFSICAVGGCLIGTYIGNRILQKISMQTVRKIAYIVMLIAGTYNLIQGII